MKALLAAFTSAVEQRRGADVAALFTGDGVYHDVFYGSFAGRERIAALIDEWFYRDADRFRWDMLEPVSDGVLCYVRYVFSYRSLLPEANGARAMFQGVAMLRLAGGLIAEYREVAETTPAFVQMGFAPERIARIAAKQGAAMRADPEWDRHRAE